MLEELILTVPTDCCNGYMTEDGRTVCDDACHCRACVDASS